MHDARCFDMFIKYTEKNIQQRYHVWEGYLRKRPIDRRRIFRADRRVKFSLKTGIFFANSTSQYDISV